MSSDQRETTIVYYGGHNPNTMLRQNYHNSAKVNSTLMKLSGRPYETKNKPQEKAKKNINIFIEHFRILRGGGKFMAVLLEGGIGCIGNPIENTRYKDMRGLIVYL